MQVHLKVKQEFLRSGALVVEAEVEAAVQVRWRSLHSKSPRDQSLSTFLPKRLRDIQDNH